MAKGHGYFALPPRPRIFLSLDASMFSRRDIETDRILVVNHHPVGPPVDPALVRIARNIDAARAYVAPTIILMPFRGWKFEQVDISISVHVLEKRALLNDFGRDRFDLFIPLSPRANEVHLGVAGRNIQR